MELLHRLGDFLHLLRLRRRSLVRAALPAVVVFVVVVPGWGELAVHLLGRLHVENLHLVRGALDAKTARALLHHALRHVRALQAHAYRALRSEHPAFLALLQHPQTPVVGAVEARLLLRRALGVAARTAAAAPASPRLAALAAPLLLARPPVVVPAAVLLVPASLIGPDGHLGADHGDGGEVRRGHLPAHDLVKGALQRSPASREVRQELAVRVQDLRGLELNKRALGAPRGRRRR